MKKRNILKLGVFVVALFVGVFNASARTIYTSYDAGDKIKVNVNSSKQLDFYVVESSNTQNVTAIYDGVLGELFWFGPTTDSLTGSTAQTKLNELTSDWNNPSEIRLVRISEINSDYNLTVDFDEDFTEPSYYNIGQSYWTQDVALNGDKYYPVVVTSWMSYSNIHAVPSNEAPSSTGYIRPVITIAKEYVVGGTTTSEIDDLSVSFKYSSDAKNTYRDVYLDLKSNKFQDNSDYRALLSKTNSNISETYSDDTNLVYMSANINDSTNFTIDAVDYFKYASMYGDVYLTIYEYDGTNFVKTSTPKLVKRLDYLPYTYRIVAQFYPDKSASFKVNDIYDMQTGEQKINFKIGEVSDKSLLSKFSNPNNESYEALIKYAQEDKNAIQSSSIKLNEKTLGDSTGEYEGVYDPSKIVDGKYYYVYLEIDTEDGKYYPLTDIALYISEENGYLVTSNYKDEVVENPKTGSASGIIGIVAITTLLIGSVAYIKMKKYSKFPQA